MQPDQIKIQRPSLAQEYALRKAGLLHIAGIDEAGRGAWAGPVVAAAVILPLKKFNLANLLEEVRDSKLMTSRKRSENFIKIKQVALSIGLGEATSEEVDNLGIIAATRQAMQRAISSLSIPPQYLLIDYLKLPDIPIEQTALPKGDMLVLSIAAASVIAKVTRDERMKKFDDQYPGYGFSRHKGYGTREHLSCLDKLGPSTIHRKTFAPVASRSSLREPCHERDP